MPPPADQRFAVTFPDGCRDEGRIEIVYWLDGKGDVCGEAYFSRDDYCAPIQKGEFKHPYADLQYKRHVPSRFGKSTDAVLDTLRWVNVGRAKPKSCAA